MGNDGKTALRPREQRTDTESYLGEIAAALAEYGVTASRPAEGGLPALVVTDPSGNGADAATVVIESDSWIECTWMPRQGTGARAAAGMIVAVLAAIHPEHEHEPRPA
jgi:hypothetical protein